ncbi:MAG: MBL fold metallo-hydrolase [Lachnospiraceae bacterium]|nr:MBL fold metallo-hydrolase [Lachnospiraceae bacterium]
MRIRELKYSATNTYLIDSEKVRIVFDTGWAGTYLSFCRALKEQGCAVRDIGYVMISHFHPDHCGIAADIAKEGAKILIADVQRDFIHSADAVFEKDKKVPFTPIEDKMLKILPLKDSRAFLKGLGIGGEIIHTPGHSDDSISLWLDSGELFVGDLNPLYELELHKGTQTGDSWDKLLALDPAVVYYGHAKTAQLKKIPEPGPETAEDKEELVGFIMKLIDKGYTLDKIRKKTGADAVFIEDVTRMYLTHPGVSVQGILDRIEIKGR